ncbi:hypothetical protein LCGC14_0898290 [marine sediment metagenome]|uniref:Uncharacterized protein n=1 Tax=marine sediment metagenome TaxID=412755 RepID=A0A0F9P218_9ZZZZ
MSATLVLDTPLMVDLSTVEVVDFRLRFAPAEDQYLVSIETHDALERPTQHTYHGAEAKVLIRAINRKDFSGAKPRLRQVVLDQLVADGKLGAGTTSEDETDLNPA